MEGRPEKEREASGREDRRPLLMVGEKQHGRADERGDTRHQGKHPAEELGERNLPLHARRTLAERVSRTETLAFPWPALCANCRTFAG